METKKTLRILLMEDSDNDAQLLLREIRRFGYEVEYERVETSETPAYETKEKGVGRYSFVIIPCRI